LLVFLGACFASPTKFERSKVSKLTTNQILSYCRLSLLFFAYILILLKYAQKIFVGQNFVEILAKGLCWIK
jgi:hypothetical protein